MAREKSLWSWLSGAIKAPSLFERIDMNRIENAVMAGMPDVEGFVSGYGQFWLELKSSERPAKPSTPIRFKVKGREAQVEWLQKRWSLGGNAWLCLQVGSGGNRRLYLIPGCWAKKVYSGLTEDELQSLDFLKIIKPVPADIPFTAAQHHHKPKAF
jgi:hypothetical protein